MRNLMVLFALMIAFGQWGCSTSHYQMNQLEEEYRAERVTRRDYEIRKGQVEIGFNLY